ncbi:uncharacterized protein LOC124171651 [Ischnura elegans]|uniref:uncharacterized protein LOC124171651 n=1 Tax=Ischnura elegans TaxID=197161 RepID=UPI001ED8BF1F|nr:uncharacterized protein LOC124171651 [Ischnura elegans]
MRSTSPAREPAGLQRESSSQRLAGMKWLRGHLILILSLLILSPSEGRDESWSVECPHECSCHLSHFKDLPMRKWMMEESTGQKGHSQETHEYNNEALHAEDNFQNGPTNEANDLMRMAICVLTKDTQASDLLEKLPTDLEVLTLLQSPDSGIVTLGESIFHNQLDLLALEIQGFQGYGDDQVSGHHGNTIPSHFPSDGSMGESQTKERITLHIESIQQLHSLQYLNLQYVQIEGNGYLFHDEGGPTPKQSMNYKYEVHEDDLEVESPDYAFHNSHQLVFLTPEPEDEILPYGRYRREQEQLKSSIYIGLPNLIFLRLYACGLKEVNWKMFDGLPQLEYLSLEENHLRFIPEFTFYGAPNLKTLSLAYNKLLSLQYTSLAGLLELRKLDLSHNNFSHLSELSLPPLPHLKTADFRHNPIETVFSSTFEIMNATEILYLGGDDIGIEIIQNSFSGLKSLLKLFIHNVNIDIIERVTLTGMPLLRELEMKGSIKAIDFDAFAEVPKLEQLTLSHCQIKTISMDAFIGVFQLIYLDLSYNDLESLPPGIFDQHSSLKELLLQNNKFKELPERVFQNIQAKMIRLDGNPWHCTCAMMGWRETSINKVKERTNSICQNHYDKGLSCRQSGTAYIYDKRVAPQCETPVKYKNWSVFHVLRKVLRCKKYTYKANVIKQSYSNYISKQGLLGMKTRLDESNKLVKKIKPQNEMQAVATITDSVSLVEQQNNETGSETISTSYPEEKQPSSTSLQTVTTSNKPLKSPNTSQSPQTYEDIIVPTTEENGTKIPATEHPHFNPSISNTMAHFPTPSTAKKSKIYKKENVSQITAGRDNDLQNDLLSFLQPNSDRVDNGPPSLKFPIDRDTSKKPSVLKKQGDISINDREYILFDGNKKIKVSKKAYKLEMERQAKERLRSN